MIQSFVFNDGKLVASTLGLVIWLRRKDWF
jgi:hypothetical protein